MQQGIKRRQLDLAGVQVIFLTRIFSILDAKALYS